MQNPYKKITASLLLFSYMLTSCYNPNIGIGKRALPTPAGPADKQRQYEDQPHDKYSPKPPSHTWTTADKHPITFTYHNGQWQAAIKEHAAHGSSQHRQLPVVFEPGLALEDVVDSNPAEQKQLLHLCPSEEDLEKPGYVYVGRAPSQAKSQPQLLRSPAARQRALPSQVRLAQQQATAQPQQAGTSPEQAQEQPGRQAVLALPGPVQEIGENPRSQDQLPTTPARARSKALPAPSRETPRQRVAQKQLISAQRAPNRRALSWRNQHELLHSQRAPQAKRAQSAAMAKPVKELAQPAAPSQAIVPLTPTQPPSLADKAPQGIASHVLLAQGGQQVRFMHRDGQWWASVRERIGVFSRVWVLPVACQGHGDVAKALADLQEKPTQYTQRRIHVMYTKQTPYVPQFVYLGAQGLQGGRNGAAEASGSEEPQDEPAAGEPEGAQGSGQRQSLAAPQDHEASLANAFFDAIHDNNAASVADWLRQDSSLLEKIVARDNGQGAMRERTPLMYAAQLGNQPMVSLLIEQGAALDQADKNGITPLMIAAQEGHLEVAQYLVEHGAAVNHADSDGWTPLWIAAQKGHLEVVQYLVEQGADVHQAASDGVTPLFIAAGKGHLAVAQFLVQAGAAVNQNKNDAATPLFIAAHQDHLEVAQYLVAHGAQVNQAMSGGWTPLWIAAQEGHLEVAQYLVEQGADVHQAASDGVTPLWIAAQKGHLAVAQYLVGHGAQVDQANKNGTTPLYVAAQEGHLETAQYLVGHGAAVDQANKHGATPLYVAAQEGQLAVAQCLIEHGAQVDQATSDGATPLLIAAQEGHLEVAQYLVEQGAQVDQANKHGATPLLIAALKGHLEVVQYLVGHRAQVDQTTKNGATPLWIAAQQGHLAVVQFLAQEGAAVDQAENDGWTPLLIAALKGHLEVVQYLVGHGAAVDQANKHGATPLYVAAQEGQLETVQYLVGHGAAVNQAAKDGATPLYVAAQHDHLELAQCLVEHGAAVDQADINGVTPLWIAAQNGHLACMRWLLQKGAHANISNHHHTPLHETASSRRINKNRKAVAAILVQEAKVPIDPEDTAGDTPLSWAAQNDDLAMVQFFVANGANIHHVAHSDRSTPLLWAAKNGHQGVVAYLVKQGANIEAMNNKGATPLHVAAEKGHLAVVQYLQATGANIEATDKEGRKPLWIAIEKGHAAVAQFLAMQQLPYVPKFYLGEQGLKGGMDRASEPSSSGEPQGEPATEEQAKHGPSKAVKIFKGEDKEGVDLREYGSWYDDTTLEYLARTIKQSQHHPPMVIFHHHPPNKNMSFANQITQLQLLKHSKSKKAALFLCHEPVVGHHYLFGMLYEHRLILLNPLGASDHQNLYAALAAAKQQGIVKEIYLSRTRIQQEEELVSCGPISAEWMLHYGAMDEEHLGKVVDELCSAGEKREKQVGQGQEATMLPYQEVEVSPWLPASLHGLVHGNPASYKGELVKLRRSHLARLEPKRASGLEEDRDEQVCFNQMVLERKDILSLEPSEAPQGLAKRAEQAKFKPTSGAERTQLASSHAVPRALERTESQGTTQLELAQIEAKKLKEQIAKLYSRLPQATEEADSKVVHELTACLVVLLELEHFCAPAQGSDGAEEYIARLRKAHRSRWGQTAYGAAVSKQLTALLAQAYGQELRRLASERLVNKTSEGVARLAQVLGQLAALHQEQGAQTGDLAYYTDAAILYQNVLRVCEEEMKKVESQAAEALGYQAQIAAAYRGLAKIREALLASGKGRKAGVVAQGGMRIAQLQEEISSDKQVLQDLRADAKTSVAQLEALLSKQGSPEEVLAGEKAYIEESRALFADIAKTVREFLARLYQESEQALGPAPCKYTVMGLGSMALAQMTPYSDLAFAILMEEAPDKATAREYKAYLRELTHLVHCRVINLGETTIPISKYGMSLDHLSKRGIHFDVGAKTPLGRKDKFYDLIQPVAGMLRYLKNEGNKIAHIDKNLPYILESTCYVHGDGGLYEDYEAMKEPFLQEAKTAEGLPIHKARALKRLLEGVVEMDYSKPGLGEARPKKGGLADFEPQLGLDDEERLYDVKQAIYRLPDRLLYGLAMYYGLRPESGWDAVEQLAEKKVIGIGEEAQEAAHHLQYAVSFATMLRLKTYLHHDQQAERITMLRRASQQEAAKDVQEMFLLPEAALQAGGSLFKYYYTALPLHRKMEAFFKELGSRQQLLELSEVLGLDKDLAYQLATLFEKEEKVAPSKEAGFFQAEAFYDDSDKTRGDIYRRLLDHEAAKGCYEQALQITQEIHGPEHPEVASSLNNLGSAWNQLGKPEQAIKYYERALAIEEQAYGPEHPEVASSLNNLGEACRQLGDPKQAISYLERALAIEEQAYGPEHPEVASSLNNLGEACRQLGDPKQAISYLERALPIAEQAYRLEHPHVATILNNLGFAWHQLGDPKEAISYLERALAIEEQAYGPKHPLVARSLNNLGRAWIHLGDSKQAISYLERALAISQHAYRPEHPHVATSLNSLGGAWYQLGDSRQAIECFKRALAINEQAYGPAHPQIAANLNNLGFVWNQLGDPKQAISYLERALPINEQAYGPAHPQVAANLNNLGFVWNQLGDPKQAISYLERALPINEQAYGPKHPEVATSLNNLGFAWNKLRDWSQAISYHKRALAIEEQVYGPDHPSVATSLNNLGGAWNDLGNPKEAISCLERALDIREQVYGPAHSEVAVILNNLGLAWYQLGKSKEAKACYERALAIREQVYGPAHPEVATSLSNLGSAWNQLGGSKQAISYHKRALAISQQAYGPAHPEVAAILNNLGLAWNQLGDHKEAISYFERALAIKEQAYGLDHPHVAKSLNNLGLAWNQLGVPKQAIEYFERALAISQQAYGPAHPEVATSLSNLGGAWNQLGDSKQAISYLERALPINEQAYGPDHPHVATTLNNLGSAWNQLGKSKHAIECFKQALPIYEQAYGPEHPHVATSLSSLGSSWNQLGDPKQAISYYEQALAIYEQVYGPEHPEVATSLSNLGSAWNQLGDSKQAISYHKRALAISQQAYGPAHPEVAAILNNLGEAWRQLGNPKQAISYYERALPIYEQAYSPEHPHVATSLNNLGSAWYQLENPKQAISYLERALAINEQAYGPDNPKMATSLNNLGSAWDKLGEPKQALSYLERAFHIMKKAYGEHHPSTQTIKRNMEELAGRLEHNVAHQASRFIQACVAGKEDLATSMPMRLLSKDLYDAQGNPLICWMAQHAMMATLDQVLELGWNPNLPNARQVYPLHYGAMKNPDLTSRLLQAGAHPFVQTPKGNTPAQVARNKGKVATLAVLLPSLEGISFKDAAAFEDTYQAYKQRFSMHHQDAEELLRALELALQLGDADLTLAIQAKQASQNLLRQLIDQYPLAAEAIQARFASMLP